MTHIELEGKIAERVRAVTNAQSLVMIQCVGCRNEERNYCSRLCCSGLEDALLLKEKNPAMDIYVLFRECKDLWLKGRLLPRSSRQRRALHPLRTHRSAGCHAR